MRLPSRAICATLLLLASTPAWVHHSGAMFDLSKQVAITGAVMDFHWTNPHASFSVQVADSAGAQELWAIEMGSPNNLVHEGWKRTTLSPGDKVSVTVRPLRDGKPGGLFVSIRLPDGRTLGTADPAR